MLTIYGRRPEPRLHYLAGRYREVARLGYMVEPGNRLKVKDRADWLPVAMDGLSGYVVPTRRWSARAWRECLASVQAAQEAGVALDWVLPPYLAANSTQTVR